MHDRLQAAQAVQMTSMRSGGHTSDLRSLRILQEIGYGGEERRRRVRGLWREGDVREAGSRIELKRLGWRR